MSREIADGLPAVVARGRPRPRAGLGDRVRRR